jgi:hypothetical protein
VAAALSAPYFGKNPNCALVMIVCFEVLVGLFVDLLPGSA